MGKQQFSHVATLCLGHAVASDGSSAKVRDKVVLVRELVTSRKGFSFFLGREGREPLQLITKHGDPLFWLM